MGAVYTLQGEGWWSNWIACDFLFGPYVMDLYLSIYMHTVAFASFRRLRVAFVVIIALLLFFSRKKAL